MAHVSRKQEKFLEALSVVLQHTTTAADQRSICCLQRVSRAARLAVQQSAAGATDVRCTLQIDTKDPMRPKLPSFAAWVAKHLGLVRSLDVRWQFKYYTRGTEGEGIQLEAQQLIERSLRATAASSSSCSQQTASAAATAATQACQLRSYSSNIPLSFGVLGAWLTDTLTRLHVVVPKGDDWVSSISGLRHLRDLSLETAMWYEELPHACVPAIHQLTQLTKLAMLNPSQEAVGNLQLLPKQLRDLTLIRNTNNISPTVMTLNLQHLQQLEQLQLTSSCDSGFTEASALPTQLKHLNLDMACPVIRALGLTMLQQLETLQMNTSAEEAAVGGLTALSSIAHMALSSKRTVIDLDEAAAWKHLPKLQELTVHVTGYQQEFDCDLLVQHIAAATQLTRLELSMQGIGPHALVFFEHITTLTRLRELSLLHFSVLGDLVSTPGAHHLTALKALTCLDVHCVCVFDECTIALLASKLTNLKRLELRHCPLDSGGTVALPAVGKLTKLERLNLFCNNLSGPAAQDGLLMLTGLAGLTKLVGFQSAGREALDAFWAMIRASQQNAHQ